MRSVLAVVAVVSTVSTVSVVRLKRWFDSVRLFESVVGVGWVVRFVFGFWLVRVVGGVVGRFDFVGWLEGWFGCLFVRLSCSDSIRLKSFVWFGCARSFVRCVRSFVVWLCVRSFVRSSVCLSTSTSSRVVWFGMRVGLCVRSFD